MAACHLNMRGENLQQVGLVGRAEGEEKGAEPAVRPAPRHLPLLLGGAGGGAGGKSGCDQQQQLQTGRHHSAVPGFLSGSVAAKLLKLVK